MSEYLTYTLWRNREERMPHELERRRAAQERLEQDQLDEQVQEQILGEHRPGSVRELPVPPEAAEPADALGSEPALGSLPAPAETSPVTAEPEHQLVKR